MIGEGQEQGSLRRGRLPGTARGIQIHWTLVRRENNKRLRDDLLSRGHSGRTELIKLSRQATGRVNFSEAGIWVGGCLLPSTTQSAKKMM